LLTQKINYETSSHPVLLLETSLLKLANISRLVQVENFAQQQQMPSFTPPAEKKKSSSEKVLFEKKQTKKKTHSEKTEEVKQEKAELKITLTKEIINEEWSILKKKLQDEMPIISNHFSKTTIKNISNNFIHYSTNSRIAYQMLNEDIDKITTIFSEHFHTPVKVVFEYEEPKTGKNICMVHPMRKLRKSLRNSLI